MIQSIELNFSLNLFPIVSFPYNRIFGFHTYCLLSVFIIVMKENPINSEFFILFFALTLLTLTQESMDWRYDNPYHL